MVIPRALRFLFQRRSARRALLCLPVGLALIVCLSLWRHPIHGKRRAITTLGAAWPEGLHPRSIPAFMAAGIDPARITQTIGDFPESAGTHAPDGVAAGRPYTAAIDLWVGDLDEGSIRRLLGSLGRAGFAAWYRKPGFDHWPAPEYAHVHAVYAGCPMKRLLRDQIHDYLAGRNGLHSHARYNFYQPSEKAAALIRQLFTENNPVDG